ncbi:acyltransferase family protein [Chryseobacterium viscerum]|uniref:Acyltransferase n=1 Tax=Chryseobacterium viscerum TaxID=1037377 RepID=A0A5N4BSD9_9FLAO|nr:acyltransferase family protein [Chryseobacterium viscerum]KAB1231353.1 acyltransferase [Chryseobacterium viscerum]
MKFRNDITFLRAISVIAVLFYHFKFSFFQGGFIGVDVFFVISGYLMTRIILTGFEKNNFKYWDYLQKRINRIVPALLVMITFFAIIVYFLLPTQFIPYTKSYFSSSMFFSNIYYYLNTGYFDGNSQFNFLLHTWSLSVEWQFYLIYPLILLSLSKLYLNKKRVFNILFLLILILSFSSMILHNKYDQSYSFYIFYTRAWEMMFGGLAFLYADIGKNISQKFKNVIVIASFILIAGSIYFINSHSMLWPSFLTLIPVVSTTVILLFNLNWAVFGNRIITFTGNISYSLYLWHWPFYVLSLFFAMNDRVRYKIVFILLSLIFASLSYYFVERKKFQKKSIAIVAISVILFIVSYSLTMIMPDKIFDDKTAKLVFAKTQYVDSQSAADQYSLNDKYFKYNLKFSDYNLHKIEIDKSKKYIILIGDSHAGMFSETLNNIIKNTPYKLLQITADGTYPMINSKTEFAGPRDFFNYFFKVYFPEIKNNVVLVIINSNYSAYGQKDLEQKIDFTEKFFSENNIKNVYLGQTPNYYVDFPTQFYIENRYNIVQKDQKYTHKKTVDTDKYMKNRLKGKYIELLNHNVNEISDNGTPYIHDTNHLTTFGTLQYRDIIQKFILHNFLNNKYSQ